MASSDLMSIHQEGFCFRLPCEMRVLLNVPHPALMLHHFMGLRPVADCAMVWWLT